VLIKWHPQPAYLLLQLVQAACEAPAHPSQPLTSTTPGLLLLLVLLLLPRLLRWLHP
jgi:hypothetical protein